MSNTPIATLLTDNSELDQQLLGMLLHRGQAPAKQLSRRLKFVDFCVNQGYLPLPIPTEPVTYMRFMLWLPANGITSGWKGCLSYASEVAAWNRQLGFTDTRLEISYWWSTFKLNFRNMVLCHKANTKMPLRASMLLMLLDSLDLGHLPHGSVTDLRDAAAYTLLYFTSQRIGHVALAVGGSRAHLLRFGNLLFWPSLTAPTIVFILFPSTKTHRAAENNGFWSAIATQPQLRFCPVMLLRLLFMRTFRGDQNGFLFTMSNRTDPLTRSTFTHNLRRRLGAAGVDVKDYSGISFRRGALSTLGQSGLASHALADFADHADVQTSRTYITDSMEARANTGRIIGDALHSADRWTTLPTLTRRLSFGSIPAGAAHVLYAANLFGDADATFTALLEANPQLPLADKASTNGFSMMAVVTAVRACGHAVTVDGYLAANNSGPLRATGKVIIVCEPQGFVALTPSAPDAWSAVRAFDAPEPPFTTYLIPQTAVQAIVIGLPSLSNLELLRSQSKRARQAPR